MKLAKLSLAAIVALGVSAFADVENVKFSGDAKLYYGATDSGNNDLFDRNSAYGQAALDLAATADLADSVKFKIGLTALSSLGLENNLVQGIWAGYINKQTGNLNANITGGSGIDVVGNEVKNVDSQWWVNEAWLAKSFGNTTVKVGRQELDTPLAFSEKWNIAENTFDAAVVLNKDIPQTTLVAAWVGRGNGAPYGSVVMAADNGNDPFYTYGHAIALFYNTNAGTAIEEQGAYAVGAISSAIPMTTVQAWYYSVVSIANAWWLQADVNLKDIAPGLSFGAQYAYLDPQGAISTLDESSAWAVKVGYGFEGLKVSAAYSKTDDDGVVAIANTATGAAKGSQSKLYTDAWWNYGYVGMPATDAWNIAAEYSMEGIADFGAYYTHTSYDANSAKNSAILATVYGGAWNNDVDMSEFTLTASKSFGNLSTALAYIYTDADDQNFVNGKPDSYNTVQVYLTYNF